MKRLFLLVAFAMTVSFSVTAQEKIVFKQTFIKAKPGSNYGENLRTKFAKFAQMRIDNGMQSGWHVWAVVGNPQAPFTHLIVEPMTMSEMRKWEETSWGERAEMRKEAMPGMTDNDWREFLEQVRGKREIVAETISTAVQALSRDENVQSPDDYGVLNFMKVAEGKGKTYEGIEKKFWAAGIPKNSKQTGWALGKRLDKNGTETYWNYWTVDWFSSYSDIIDVRLNTPSWDADREYANLMKIRDLKENVIIRKVMMLDK